MAARKGGEGSGRAASGPKPKGPAAGDSAADDEFEILEVTGVNETEELEGAKHEESAPPPPAEPPPSRPSEELKEALREREHYHDLWLRQQAEFDNFRKRSEREGERQRSNAAADLIRRLLPVLDNLDRAIRTSAGDDPLREGVVLIRQQLVDLLGKEGLQAIASLGAPFDPHRHEAVEVLDVPGCEAGMVLEEMQTGYMFKDRLIRPTLVKVSGSAARAGGRDEKAG